jgi:hypothetical protein
VFCWAATGHRMTTSLDRSAPPSSSHGFPGARSAPEYSSKYVRSVPFSPPRA